MSENREIKLQAEIQENQQSLSRAQAELEKIKFRNSEMAAKIAAKKQELDDLREEARLFREANLPDSPPAPGPSPKSPNKK